MDLNNLGEFACLPPRQVVKEHMPDEAAAVFEKCINEKALVLSGKVTRARVGLHPRASPTLRDSSPVVPDSRKFLKCWRLLSCLVVLRRVVRSAATCS